MMGRWSQVAKGDEFGRGERLDKVNKGSDPGGPIGMGQGVAGV